MRNASFSYPSGLKRLTLTTSGVIAANGPGAAVALFRTTVDGGTLETSNGGIIECIGSGFYNDFDGSVLPVIIKGEVVIEASGLHLKGRIDFDGGTLSNDASDAIANPGIIDAIGTGIQGVIASAIVNTGVIEAGGGTLAVIGAVSGSGHALINKGALAFTSTFSEDVEFGVSGELQLSQSQSYAGVISGFSKAGTTSLDLDDIAFISGTTTATYSGTTAGGVLTVTDGAHTADIDFSGDYTSSTFTLSSDGNGGVLVVDPTAAGPSSVSGPALALVHAIARFTTPWAVAQVQSSPDVFDCPVHFVASRARL